MTQPRVPRTLLYRHLSKFFVIFSRNFDQLRPKIDIGNKTLIKRELLKLSIAILQMSIKASVALIFNYQKTHQKFQKSILQKLITAQVWVFAH